MDFNEFDFGERRHHQRPNAGRGSRGQGRGRHPGRGRHNFRRGTTVRLNDGGESVEDKLPRFSSSDRPAMPSKPKDEAPPNLYKHVMGFKQLNELSEKDAIDIIHECNKQFKATLDNTFIKPDQIVLLLRCLVKICDSDVYLEYQTTLLLTACNSNFIKTLEKFFTDVPYCEIKEKQFNSLFWFDMERFWFDMFKFYKFMLNLSPTTAVETLCRLIDLNQMCLDGLTKRQSERFPPELIEEYSSIQELLSFTIDSIKTKKEEAKASTSEYRNKESTDYGEPPDDFRLMSVIPSVQELTTHSQPFLRPNIINGAYRDVEHYLDVQFRLLREDYVSPLRETILQYIADPKRRRYDGGRFYRNVRFEYRIVTRNKFGVMVNFEDKKKKLNPKQFFRRLLFGSLVCFTSDNFQSIIYATIIERSQELLSKHSIIVEFLDPGIDDSIFQKEFVMFESDVYYLQYGPVLSILQKFKNNLPMEDYIVRLMRSKLPLHVQETFKISGQLIDLSDEFLWNRIVIPELDQSQLNAYKMALTRNFVTIQGPPGTGKTFIGLKIVLTLLDNLTEHNLPILILCYTNHALDQFLEGILKKTQSIVRIGGQSRNPEFADRYNLRNLRRNTKLKSNPHYAQLKKIAFAAEKLRNALEFVDNSENIISVNVFMEFIPNFLVYSESLCQAFEDNFMYRWLMLHDNQDLINRIPLRECEETRKNLLEYVANLEDENDALFDFEDENEFIDGDDFVQKKKDKKFTTLTALKRELLKLDNIFKDNSTEDNQINFENKLRELKFLENLLRNYDETQDYENNLNENPTEMTWHQRWMTYFSWKKQLKAILVQQLRTIGNEFRGLNALNDEFNSMADSELLKKVKVVGVTTTGAAHMRLLLQSLAPAVVIVEEAAEVLESHIVVNLTRNCKHVILIGDHQQLRPSTASYQLRKKYNLDISLFERMFNCSQNNASLKVQHRMRPEISNLITPSIYKELFNHESVYKYPNVIGTIKNLFFIDHNVPEEQDEAINSKQNEHEATFVAGLAKYFVQQRYSPKDITILVTYSSQLFAVKKLQKRMPIIAEVKTCILDGFQGDENKIILLSLVRSNTIGSIGFLGIENRVCVALSRAKEGFFIIGNMSLLESKSDLWKTIKQTLVEQGSIGKSLVLRCERHGTITQVSNKNDFMQVPEGGCLKACGAILPCEHTCQSTCHFYENHNNYMCKQKCERECKLGHKCKLLCCQPCKCVVNVTKDLPCGHTETAPCYLDPNLIRCVTVVRITLDLCSHSFDVKCFETKKKIPCIFPCENRLPCGHGCINKCHMEDDPEHIEYKCRKNCEKFNKNCSAEHRCKKPCFDDCDLCPIKIKKKRSGCTHSVEVACHENPNEKPCMQKCVRTMACGHYCKKLCHQPCTDCEIMVRKRRHCGHDVDIKCKLNVDEVACNSQCLKLLGCGHRCRDKCGQTCGVKKCMDLVPSPVKSFCGHNFGIPCYLVKQEIDHNMLPILMKKFCDAPCNATLIGCNHKCKAKCGTCQNRIHVPCSEPCGNVLVCGHSCWKPCREACNICDVPCELKCTHNKCDKKCGIPCVTCKESCPVSCKHQKCKKKCGEICDIKPCMESCELTLKCGHKCRGLCGDRCPDICKECNPDSFPDIFFGEEDEEDSRFVMLIDCGHSVEVNGLNTWIEKSGNSESEGTELKMPECPYCKRLIMNTPRYSNYVKNALKDVIAVKRKLYGSKKDIVNILIDLNSKLKEVVDDNIFHGAAMWTEAISTISKHFKHIDIEKDTEKILNNRINLKINLTSLQNLRSKLNFIQNLQQMLVKHKEFLGDALIAENINFIFNSIHKSNLILSPQLVSDYNNEMIRIKHLVGITSVRENLGSTMFIRYLNSLFKLKEISETDSMYFGKIIKAAGGISETERKMIVQAMGFRQGHWFKCPNGHIYCIGECGGAMQRSKCPECGATIGGQSHQLDAGNSLAREMDGASHAAYSEAATQEFLIREGLIPILW